MFLFPPKTIMKLFEQYQLDIIKQGIKQVQSKGWVYLSMWMRTRKTMTSLGIVKEIGGSTIFITKKTSIDSILGDIKMIGINNIDVINYESLHKINKEYDNWILDESHCLGSIPKPNKKVKQLKSLIKKNNKVIFLSGTPTPENLSIIYHQFFVLPESPFIEKSFYQWAKNNCRITQKKVGFNRMVNDYTDCFFDVKKLDMISCTQEEAGFKTEIKEHFIEVKMNEKTKFIIQKLKKDKILEGGTGIILADTKVKEMQKIHQLGSGTCLLESGEKVLLDDSKVIKIKELFNNKKIVIFYKFKAELDLIKSKIDVCETLAEFEKTNKSIALQFISGREGINLSKAEALVFFNMDYSAVTYFQARERIMSRDRLSTDVYFLFSDCGIERKIYEVVTKKKNFTKIYYE